MAAQRRLLILPLTAAALLAATVAWQAGHPSPAAADITSTTTVSAGPNTISQPAAAGNPSDYGSQLERCYTAPNFPLTGANPILSEPMTTAFTSNAPLSVSATFNGSQWYGSWQFVFTNRSSTSFSVDCAVIVFRAPSGSDTHSYSNAQQYGHPQQDYVEVPRGDGTSFYIVRLGFHDVPLAQRIVYAGKTFTYQFGGVPSTAITLNQMRDSIRFTADLDLSGNTALVKKYGTSRLSN
ncbi:MAG TPA: hypothetical protein VGJ07_19900 [Rugosimonospora sp.]